MRFVLPLLLSLCAPLAVARAECPAPPAGAKLPSSMDATEQLPITWLVNHYSLNVRLKQTMPNVVFLGDSITEGWAADSTWLPVRDQYKAMNLGIGYDRTQNVLWRIRNGHFAFAKPKVVVLLIGTNNIANGDTPESATWGVGAVLNALREAVPGGRIVLLGLLPRGEKPDDKLRQAAQATNKLLATCADDKTVFFRDISAPFLDAAGRLSAEVSPDFLHLSRKGYGIFAAQLEPILREFAGAK